MYSENTDLKNKRKIFIKQDKIQRRRELKLHAKYESMIEYGKKNNLIPTIFINCDIIVDMVKY